jgi:peptidoglycan/xylan/chitin deacetylase (PgdA/CDA1 family)
MRPDRLITLNLVRPLKVSSRKALPTGRLADKCLPVLMYHSISDAPENGISPYYRVNTSCTRFARQMELLTLNGYRGVTLSAGLAWLKSQAHNLESEISKITNRLSKASPVAITFDDGFHNFYTDAFPILRRHGFAATMFLPTAFIGDDRRPFSPATKSSDSRKKTNYDCLTWREIKDLHAAGIEFGSHTVSHPQLAELSWPQIESELRKSKQEIEDQLAISIENFAYPYAFPETDHAFVRRFSSSLADAGYRCCATTRLGLVKPEDDMLQLRRLPVNTCDDDALFLAKLHGNYDWLSSLQRFTKRLKRALGSSTRSGA